MDRLLASVVLAIWGGTLAESGALELSSLDDEVRLGLERGEVVVLSKRPDETGETDARFVTVAQILNGNRKEIWEVIHDKEDAELFVDGVLESEVLETGENEIVVEQRTHVGGPKGSYRYRLRHRLTPMERSDFSFISGEIRNVIGTWWIFDGPDQGTS
ncbi:MAG: SRPBCC family protein, partial [Verrucomicrobiota bacterium]